MSDGTFVLGYWDTKGLAIVSRLMFAHAGQKVEETLYMVTLKEGGGWDNNWEAAREELGKKHQHPFMNLPYLVKPDGGLIVQSNAINRYVARKCGFYGVSDEEAAEIDEIHEECNDWRKAVSTAGYSGKASDLQEVTEDGIPYWFGALEKRFPPQEKNSEYFVGKKISLADFVVYHMCTISAQMMLKYGKKSPFDGHPNLDRLCKRIRADPKLEAYFASDAAKMPFHNRMAAFGAAPSEEGM